MDWMSASPPMPTTNPARYIAPTIFAVVLYVFFSPSLFGSPMDMLSSASILFCFINTVASPSFHPGKGRGWLEVAGPSLEGGQVAILRLQRAVTHRYRARFLYLTP